MPEKKPQKTHREAVEAMAARIIKESPMSYEDARAIAIRAAIRNERDHKK